MRKNIHYNLYYRTCKNYLTQILKLESFSIFTVETFVRLIVHKFLLFYTKKINFLHLKYRNPAHKSENSNFEIRKTRYWVS